MSSAASSESADAIKPIFFQPTVSRLPLCVAHSWFFFSLFVLFIQFFHSCFLIEFICLIAILSFVGALLFMVCTEFPHCCFVFHCFSVNNSGDRTLIASFLVSLTV